MRNEIRDEYFEWLFDQACGKRYSKEISFRKLLMFLHDTEFRYLIRKDQNRAEDGIDLRYRFVQIHHHDRPDYEDYLRGPCSVLEMMVALAIRCEESIMDDSHVGDRTRQWFWCMIGNLGLGSMTDTRFDKNEVDKIVNRFLDRKYESDGRGGLFIIDRPPRDLRDVEIWYQLLWYLDNIT